MPQAPSLPVLVLKMRSRGRKLKPVILSHHMLYGRLDSSLHSIASMADLPQESHARRHLIKAKHARNRPPRHMPRPQEGASKNVEVRPRQCHLYGRCSGGPRDVDLIVWRSLLLHGRVVIYVYIFYYRYNRLDMIYLIYGTPKLAGCEAEDPEGLLPGLQACLLPLPKPFSLRPFRFRRHHGCGGHVPRRGRAEESLPGLHPVRRQVISRRATCLRVPFVELFHLRS